MLNFFKNPRSKKLCTTLMFIFEDLPSKVCQSLESSAIHKGELPIWKLKLDIQRTSVVAFQAYENAFSAPFAILHDPMEFYFFYCKSLVHHKLRKWNLGFSHFSLQMENCPITAVEDSGQN